MKKTLFAFCLLLLPLSGCVTKAQTGSAVGAAGGAVAGQAIGRSTEATLIGAAVGAILGYVVGNEMDKFDHQQMYNAYEHSPSGQTTAWVNPDTGNRYSVTPQPAYQQRDSGQVCREAEILTTIDGRPEKSYATACRENGRWVIQ